MGWRGTLRAIQAAERRAEREAQKRHRELQRHAKEQAKMSVLEQARLEVDTYENQLEVLLSIHKEQGELWDWRSILNQGPPPEPARTDHHASRARAKMAAYKPGFFEKIFGGARKKEEALALEVHLATGRDEQDFQNEWSQYQRDLVQCEDERRLAAAILDGNRDAYVRVLKEMSPFGELSDLGSSLSFRVHTPKLIEASVTVKGEQAIPSEIKTLTASGKVSKKAIAKGRFHEIYQDYVSGCVLRVARELFALLPIDSTIVTASADLFDSATGRTSEQPILSVAIDRSVINRLNFERLDPSDAIEGLVHRGDFKGSRRTGAFVPIDPLTPEDLTPQKPAPVVPLVKDVPPIQLTQPAINPLAAKWSEALRRNEISFGFLTLTANDLASLLGYQPQETFNLTESKGLTRAAEQFGYSVEPDPRYGAGNFWGTRELGLFRPASGSMAPPSETFVGASALLQLCLLVAAADGTVDRGELDQFRKFVEGHFHFNPDENQRLTVLETLLARNAAAAKVTLGRTAKRIPPEKHISVGQFLVDVAAADGVISPKEHKALVRIFEAIGLRVENLESLIKLSATQEETIIEAGAVPAVSTPVPQRPVFQLDMTRVATISQETSEVIGILAKAMVDEEDDEIPVTEQVPVAHTTSPTAVPSTTEVSRFAGLDSKYHPLAERLFTKDQWSREEFSSLARQHQLMLLSVFDALNEWADERLGDFLLEGDDPIVVRRSLLISQA
jgi:tellurite resistance protein